MSRFNGMGQHIGNPKTSAQQRANNTGGGQKDADVIATAASHSALFSSGAVKLAVVTTPVTAATPDALGRRLGSGAATIFTLGVDIDGVTPRLNAEKSQTVFNPVTTPWLLNAQVLVADTGSLNLIISMPLAQVAQVVGTVAGSRDGNVALTSLLGQLSALGLVEDGTTA